MGVSELYSGMKTSTSEEFQPFPPPPHHAQDIDGTTDTPPATIPESSIQPSLQTSINELTTLFQKLIIQQEKQNDRLLAQQAQLDQVSSQVASASQPTVAPQQTLPPSHEEPANTDLVHHTLRSLQSAIASWNPEENGEDRQRRDKLKTRNATLKGAPKFEGKTDFTSWWRQIELYLDEQEIESARERFIITSHALTGTAAEYLNSMESGVRPENLLDLHNSLNVRFGKTEEKRLQEFNKLRQQSEESLREYYDRLQRAALGLRRSHLDMLEKFKDSIRDQRIVHGLCNLKFDNLRDALEAAENEENALKLLDARRSNTKSNFAPRSNSNIICHRCGKKGHQAKHCRSNIHNSKGKPPNRKAQTLEADTYPDEECNYASEGEEECFVLDPESGSEVGEELDAYQVVVDVDAGEKRQRTEASHDDVVKRLQADRRRPAFAPATGESSSRLQNVPVQGMQNMIKTDIPNAARPGGREKFQLPRYNRWQRNFNSQVEKTIQEKINVPASLLTGLILAAAPEPEKISAALAKRAQREVTQWSNETIADSSTLELVSADAAQIQDRSVQSTFHIPIKFPGRETHYGLVDSGSQVSLISTALAQYLGLIEEGQVNIIPAPFKVKGITDENGESVYCPLLVTRWQLGRGGGSRYLPVQLCLIPSETYRLVVGQDLLIPLDYVMDSAHRLLRLNSKANNGECGYGIRMISKEEAGGKLSVQKFKQWSQMNQPALTEAAPGVTTSLAERIYNLVDSSQAEFAGEETAELLTYQKITQQLTTREAAMPSKECSQVELCQVTAKLPPSATISPRLATRVSKSSPTSPTHVEIAGNCLLISPHGRGDTRHPMLHFQDDQEAKPAEGHRVVALGDHPKELIAACIAKCDLITKLQRNEDISQEKKEYLFRIEELSFLNSQQLQMTMPEQVLPAKPDLGDFGTAELPSRDTPELSSEDLSQFMQLNQLKDEGGRLPLAQRAWRLKEGWKQNPDMINPSLNWRQKRQLLQLLLNRADVLAVRIEDLQQPAKVQPMRISTLGGPVRARAYRQTSEENEFLRDTCNSMNAAKIISRSQSEWALACFVAYRRKLGVKQKSGKKRKVVDCRPLNRLCPTDAYPIPPLDQLLDELSEAQFIGATDLKSGYWQVPIEENDSHKAAFITQFGLWEYRRVLFGFKNAPAHFCRCIDSMISEAQLRDHNVTFVDDITTHATTWEGYLSAQDQLFRTLGEKNWLVAAEKLRLGYRRIALLGWLVGCGCKTADPQKTEGITKMSRPTTVTQVKTFLGATGWYRDLVPNYGTIARPLTLLTKNDQEFLWGPSQQSAWQMLKDKLASPPVLSLPHREGLFKIYTDWSKEGIAAILHQVQADGKEKPVCYKSRACRGAEMNYSSAEGELLAVVWGLSKLKQYVGGRHFEIITDSAALKGLATSQNLTGKIARWAMFLAEFDYAVVHRPGKAHGNADGISRGPLPAELPTHSEKCMAEVWRVSISESSDESDSSEEWVDSPTIRNSSEACIISVNTAKKAHMTHTPCRVCGEIPSVGQVLCCGRCREVYHRRCIKGGNFPGYWYCSPCQPLLDLDDPSQDMELMSFLKGGPRPEWAGESDEEYLRKTYSFYRGCLMVHSEGEDKILPPPAERPELIEHAHDILMHAGSNKVLQYLGAQYSWPGMAGMVREWCADCLPCSLQKAVFRRRDVLHKHLAAPGPRVSWSLDCAPRLNSIGGARTTIIVGVDDFSKYTILTSLPELSSTTTEKWFLEHIVARFGKPQRVRVDNGNEWKGSFRLTLELLGVELITTHPHCPWQNGRAERMIRQVKSLLRRVLQESPNVAWEQLLPWVMTSINSTIARSTGMSPHLVFYGEHPPLLLQDEPRLIIPQSLEEVTGKQLNDYVTDLTRRLSHLRAQARLQEKDYLRGMEKDYGSHPHKGMDLDSFAKAAQPGEFSKGQFIIVKKPRVGVWGIKSAGPYIILEDLGSAVRIRSLASGRDSVEDKTNCKVLKGWIRLE